MVCDDDVEPSPEYLETFVRKYCQYGPDAVLCARGHVFFPHAVSEEQPEKVWEMGEAMAFYDERADDCQVHFMHADNCLIPKHILLLASQFALERYEFTLVDDYWLSFVLSHRLKIPLWKIKAERAFKFSDSANDPRIAMFHNPHVSEQRINFYIRHMRSGWPGGGTRGAIA